MASKKPKKFTNSSTFYRRLIQENSVPNNVNDGDGDGLSANGEIVQSLTLESSDVAELRLALSASRRKTEWQRSAFINTTRSFKTTNL